MFRALLILALSGSCVGQTISTQALDCRNPVQVHRGLKSSLCANYKDSDGKPKPVGILQRVRTHTIRAVRCEQTESVFREICGAFGHTKMYSPPKLNTPVTISAKKCRDIAQQGTLEREDGTMVPLRSNEELAYQYVRHGSLRTSPNNVECTGSTINIHGEAVSSLVEMVDTQVKAKNIEVEVELGPTGKLVDLDSNQPMPLNCLANSECQVGGQTYILLEQPPSCELAWIQTVDMQLVDIVTKGGKQAALASAEHKLLLYLGQKEPVPAGCDHLLAIYATQYKDLKIVTSEVTQIDLSALNIALQPGQLELELELRTTIEYAAYAQELSLQLAISNLGATLCQTMVPGLKDTELSPFHKHHLIRLRGDVIEELLCTPVRADIRLGEVRGQHCYRDSIPVWVNNQPVLLQADTHLILEDNELEQISCQTSYTTLVVTDDGTIITAKPEVTEVDIQIQHEFSNYLHLSDAGIQHLSYAGDLLYTKEEMTKYNQLIHFQRLKARIVESMASQYCSSNPECGDFQPETAAVPVFNLDNLKNVALSPFQQFLDLMKDLEVIGQACSIFVTILFIISVTYRVFKVVYLSCWKRVNFGKALKVSFFLDTARTDLWLQQEQQQELQEFRGPTVRSELLTPDRADPEADPLRSTSPTNMLVAYRGRQWI